MSRAIRNTFFTIAALVMTTVGLEWNKDTARQNDPVAISQAVLASQLEQDTSESEGQFPLRIDFSRQVVRLGQHQVVTFTTVPGASLDIVTQYPNGSINNSQTLRVIADGDGRFVQKYKLDNFRFLGVFHVSVIATAENRTSTVLGKYVLQTWINKKTGLEDSVVDYKYPLVP